MEKLPLHSSEAEHASNSQPRWSRANLLRRIFIVFIVVCFFIAYYLLIRPSTTICDLPGCALCDKVGCSSRNAAPESQGSSALFSAQEYRLPVTEHQTTLSTSPEFESTKIPLEAHIMSKCPDARHCLQKLILPAMEQISDKVDFRLSFIANVSDRSSEIVCKHGPTECIGDMLILCAANLPFPPTADDTLLPSTYPRTPIIRSLGFANCLISDFSRIPQREFIHQCALDHGIDFDALNQCASQQNDELDDGNGNPPPSGIALLRNDAIRNEKLGVKISCTVRLDENVWCVHDGGEWKDCVKNGEEPSVLIDKVKQLWKERN